jgi:hypothetical protein
MKWHVSGTGRDGTCQGGFTVQVSGETTLFMQKAIYYVNKPIAARGILELTDRRLYFQVQPFDASFGIRSISIDVCMITGVSIECGDLHPKLTISAADKKYEFMLSKGQELYERLRELQRNPLGHPTDSGSDPRIVCECGKSISNIYRFYPWCGTRLSRS